MSNGQKLLAAIKASQMRKENLELCDSLETYVANVEERFRLVSVMVNQIIVAMRSN